MSHVERKVPTASRTSSQEQVSVAICHRDPLLSLGVACALHGIDGLAVRHVDLSALSPAQLASAVQGSVAVCDFDTGLQLVAPSLELRERPQVVIVTPREKEADVQQALSRGVLGYLLVGCRLQEVVDGVVAASRNQRYLTSSTAELIANRLCSESLTQREAQVLSFVAMGWSNKMIGNQLGVVEGTVKCHVKAILGKLGVRGRTEAANVALRRGLVSEPIVYATTGLRPSAQAAALQPVAQEA